MAGFKNETTLNQEDTEILIEPFLDPLPEAVNHSQITISGSGISGNTVILYLNEKKVDEQIVGNDGQFAFRSVTLNKGNNSVYAISTLKENESPQSKTITVIYKDQPPKLEIETPSNGASFKREEKEIEIKGQTDEGVTVTVNERFVYVSPSGSFSLDYRLSEGENKLKIEAIDNADNKKTVEMTVTYES